MSPVAVALCCTELFPDLRAYRGLRRDTAECTTNSRTIKYNKRLHARVPLSPWPTIPTSKFPLARLSSWKSSLKIARSSVKTTRNLFFAFSLEPSISQALLTGRAMKTGFRAVRFPAVIITCWAVIWARKISNKGLPGNNKISNFSNKLTIRKTATLAAGELSNTHVISCHVMWITCLLVSSFWEDSSSLMEARDGSLESVSQTLSIRPHLFLECPVPLKTQRQCSDVFTYGASHCTIHGL